MFVAPRFLAVDDKKEHLTAIIETFQRLGAPCMGIHFDPAQPLDPASFRGVRALFIDLHLLTGLKTSDDKQHFSNIASILEANISALGGPFILILWTEHAQLVEALTAYLNEALDPEKPWCRPLAVLSLAKEQFINVGDGATQAAEALRKAVEDVVGSNPQLSALIGWETDVLIAAGETLSSLLALVPVGERTTEAFPDAADRVLSRLAEAAVGKKNVAVDPRSAVMAALAPILADRIINQRSDDAADATWTKAVTRVGDKKAAPPSDREAGDLNRMMHVAVLGPEQIRPTEWGAVVEMPAPLWADDRMIEIFGLNRDQLLREVFKVKRDDHERCRARLVRIGAVCDHAQQKPGPIPFLLGVEIPSAVERIKGPSGNDDIPAAEWSSPRLSLPGQEEAFCLHTNSRFEMTRPAPATADWRAAYRLREQLLMQLIAHNGAYVGRPGIIEF